LTITVPRDQIGQVGRDVCARLAAVFDQREKVRQPWAGLGMADKEPVSDSRLQRPQRPLRGIVREFGAGSRNTALEVLLLFE
jgi:hypothetical protein